MAPAGKDRSLLRLAMPVYRSGENGGEVTGTRPSLLLSGRALRRQDVQRTNLGLVKCVKKKAPYVAAGSHSRCSIATVEDSCWTHGLIPFLTSFQL